MSLLYIDGFDVQDASSRWDTWAGGFSYNTTTTGGGQGSSAQINISAGVGQTSIKKFTAQTTLHVGFRFYADAAGASGFCQPCFTVYGDNAATRHLWIGYVGTTRKWQARWSQWDGSLLAESTATYAGGSWVYVEAMIVIADSGGRVKLNIDGSTVIDFTGDTKNGGTNATVDAIGIGTLADFGTGSNKMYYDDLYIASTAGTVNNTFFNSARTVMAIKPGAAGSSTQLTPSTGSNNWDLVNDVPPVDTTYNASSTTGQRDTYALDNVSTGATVNGVQLVSRMQLGGSGSISAKPAVKSSSTVAYGSTRSLSAAATTYFDTWETDPATSAAWTASGVNALEAGAEVA